MLRIALLSLIFVAGLAGAFAWGIAAGHYHFFPYEHLEPRAEQIKDLLRPIGIDLPAGGADPRDRVTFDTGLLNLDLTIVNNPAPIDGFAGGMSVTEGGVLIGRSADGQLQFYDRAANAIRELPFALPPLAAETYPQRFDTGRAVRASDIRYNDIEVVTAGGGARLFVTYNHYDPDRVCFSMRLDQAELPAGWEQAVDGAEPLAWTPVLDTAPCLPPSHDRNTFGGNQAGGRIVAGSNGRLLLTTGDYEFDGVGRKTPAVSQIEGSDYGRVLEIDPVSGEIGEVSRGHRNPQALALDTRGRIWVAEHGAMGGDELNLILRGRNYGWPIVSLGVFYTSPDSDVNVWPTNPRQGGHEGYEPPRHAWIPSIAPSSMALVEDFDPRWNGDFLIATLANLGLRHVRLAGDRVLYDEPIAMGRRIRDIAVADGLVYLLFDDGRFGFLTPHAMADADPSLGQDSSGLADFGCIECHSNPQTPRLAAVFEADVASQGDIVYSEALKRAGGTWSPERLAMFLASPQAFAPGTTMPEPDLPAAAIGPLVEELRALSEEGD